MRYLWCNVLLEVQAKDRRVKGNHALNAGVLDLQILEILQHWSQRIVYTASEQLRPASYGSSNIRIYHS